MERTENRHFVQNHRISLHTLFLYSPPLPTPYCSAYLTGTSEYATISQSFHALFLLKMRTEKGEYRNFILNFPAPVTDKITKR